VAVQLEKITRRILGKIPNDHPDRSFIEGLLLTLEGYNEKTFFPKLKAERARQVGIFIKLGFHKELGLKEREYRDSLPMFTHQPEEFRGKFDYPVLVETRIPLERQCALAGISQQLSEWSTNHLEFCDWSVGGYLTPSEPYVTWMHDGSRNLKLTVREVRKRLVANERGATVLEGVSLFLAHPHIWQYHHVDLPGTAVKGFLMEAAPFLESTETCIKLAFAPIDSPTSRHGSATCGRE
jgi:hypothetical protein